MSLGSIGVNYGVQARCDPPTCILALDAVELGAANDVSLFSGERPVAVRLWRYSHDDVRASSELCITRR
jgi:hypothetical protein